MAGLDLKDRKILYELDIDARQSDSRIAKKVGLSRDAVAYRINRMTEEGYIKGFITHINTVKLGYTWHAVLFRFHNIAYDKEDEMYDWLVRKTNWVAHVESSWDVGIGVIAKDAQEYNKVISEFFDMYNSQIKDYQLDIMVNDWICTRDFLIEKKQRTRKPLLLGFEQGKTQKVEKIDKIDFKILKAILSDARKKTTEIARETGLTEMIVSYRMKGMKERGIILGYRTFLSMSKLGRALFKVTFKLVDYSVEDRKRFFNYLIHHPLVDRVTEFIPRSEIEVKMAVLKVSELYEEIAKIRDRFNRIIGDYEMLHFVEEFKNVQLPLKYLENKKLKKE
ncbi:winged helix-turn-helix transcriptional regulator [Nanoarchaeota archaeon]